MFIYSVKICYLTGVVQKQRSNSFQFCTALLTLLMMTAEPEFMLSKRSVLKFTVGLFFLLKMWEKFFYTPL